MCRLSAETSAVFYNFCVLLYCSCQLHKVSQTETGKKNASAATADIRLHKDKKRKSEGER